ncbi:pyridoxal phosphate-dependent aminotransferase [Spirosoma oryzicola]|uniref:pyridoxal phosphate-dependent aminotransferase n=1 Tax=Spirosoma oryzicola TaxID=2898794 RepID=UPI001E408EEC|nr:histidinol-phosphate transaminase [Spirosoma oryzicola]UHG94179.1 histidinol-phosphate aminotransferase family protein [Spirosoma oryzicola]
MTLVESTSVVNQPDMNLFTHTVHSPSYASLTDNFERVDKLKDYCIPVNSYFPTTAIMDALYAKMPYALKYYPSSNSELAELICRFADIADPNSVIAGNGSTELISWLNTLYVKDNLLVPVPSFGRWTDEPKGLGRHVRYAYYSDLNNQCLTADEFVDAVKRTGVRNAVLCNPNNPTGSILQKEDVIWIMQELAYLDTLIIDESFIDFSQSEPPTVKDVVTEFPNAWVLKSLGKNLGLHGLRMGYAISHPKNIDALKKHVPFWNVNGITELLLKLVVEGKADYEQSRLQVIADREYLRSAFQEIHEFTVFPCAANFIYVKLTDTINGDLLRDRLLLNQQCFVRNCGNKIGCSSQYFRVAARPKEDIDYLIAAIKLELKQLATIAFMRDLNSAGCSIHRITKQSL